MSRTYIENPTAVADLVREDAVHRDVYLNTELFDLEMAHLFRETWVFVGHDSQVPKPGDFTTTEIGRESVIMIRDAHDTVQVLLNRCATQGGEAG